MAEQQDRRIDFVEFPSNGISELAASKVFFLQVFGWSFQSWGDDYADTSSSGLASGFNADPEHRAAKPLVVLFSSDLEATRDKVVAAGGVVTREIFAFPGGRRFHFREPSGNELAVWSKA